MCLDVNINGIDLLASSSIEQVLNVKIAETTEGQMPMKPDKHPENLLRNSKLDGDIEVAEFEGTLSIHAPDDWEVYLDHQLQQFPKITMNEPGMTLSIDGDAWRIELAQNNVLLSNGKYYEAEVFSRLDYDDEDTDLEYSFHLIGDCYEILTPWQTPSGSTHVVIGIPDNQDTKYQFRLCVRLNGSVANGSVTLEEVSLVEVDKGDEFDYLDEAWLNVDEAHETINDSDWKSVWVSSTSDHGTHVRYSPSSDSASVGVVREDTPALLILDPIKRGEHYWYPICINSHLESSHADGDFSNKGWIRSDVFTYKTVVVPQVDDSIENIKLFTMTVNYNKSRHDHLALIDIIKRAASLFDKGADIYDVPANAT